MSARPSGRACKARGEIGGRRSASTKRWTSAARHTTCPSPPGTGCGCSGRPGRRSTAAGGSIGNNGDIVEVARRRTASVSAVATRTGRVGDVEWRRMSDADTGRLLLGFGHALTIDAAQGITSGEHINALPRGSAGVRLQGLRRREPQPRATWTVISEAAFLRPSGTSRHSATSPRSPEMIYGRVWPGTCPRSRTSRWRQTC